MSPWKLLFRHALCLLALVGALSLQPASALDILGASFQETVGYCTDNGRPVKGFYDEFPEHLFLDYSFDNGAQCVVSVLTSALGPQVDIQASGKLLSASGEANVEYNMMIAPNPAFATSAPTTARIKTQVKIQASLITTWPGPGGNPNNNNSTSSASFFVNIPDTDETGYVVSRIFSGNACSGYECGELPASLNLSETVMVELPVGEILYVQKKGLAFVGRGKGVAEAQAIVDPMFSIVPGEYITLLDGNQALTTDVYQIFYPDSINPVPEPQTYALFIAGLCLVGWIARRHKDDSALRVM